jgi:putative tricarboxylic transport membrane protein
MDRSRILGALPYAVLLVLAAIFYSIAGDIQYSQRPGNLGPGFWPKLAIGLIAIVSLLETVRILLGRRGEARGIGDALEGDAEEEAAAGGERHLGLLLAGVGLTLGYGILIPYLGFPLATFLFLVFFMYVGGYRRHAIIWLSSAVGVLVFAIIFLRIVYVSLPRGVAPFDRLTDVILNLF